MDRFLPLSFGLGAALGSFARSSIERRQTDDTRYPAFDVIRSRVGGLVPGFKLDDTYLSHSLHIPLHSPFPTPQIPFLSSDYLQDANAPTVSGLDPSSTLRDCVSERQMGVLAC